MRRARWVDVRREAGRNMAKIARVVKGSTTIERGLAMVGKKIQDAFNEQIKHELASSYLYLSMAACFHSKGLDGMAKWMTVQAKEENGHAMKFFDHIVERQGRVELAALDKPQLEWKSALDAFKAAYKHEQFITGNINDLVGLAQKEKDNAAQILLQWFVKEQVEEEANTSKVVQMLEMAGDSGQALLIMDAQLGKRE